MEVLDASADEWTIPLSIITGLEKKKPSAKTLPDSCFDIITKDFRHFRVVLNTAASSKETSLLATLSHYVFPTKINRLFAFDFKFDPQNQLLSDSSNIFTWDKEAMRLCIDLDLWQVNKTNHEFAICGTLPQELVVPKVVTADLLVTLRKPPRAPGSPIWCGRTQTARPTLPGVERSKLASAPPPPSPWPIGISHRPSPRFVRYTLFPFPHVDGIHFFPFLSFSFSSYLSVRTMHRPTEPMPPREE